MFSACSINLDSSSVSSRVGWVVPQRWPWSGLIFPGEVSMRLPIACFAQAACGWRPGSGCYSFRMICFPGEWLRGGRGSGHSRLERNLLGGSTPFLLGGEPTALRVALPLQLKFLNPVLLREGACLHGWCLTQVSNAHGKLSLAASVGGIKLLTALAAAASPPVFAAVSLHQPVLIDITLWHLF